MRIPGASWWRARWKLVLALVIPAVVYLALHPVMAALSQRHGFGSPDGLGNGYVTVAAALVVLRIALLTVVPAVLAYRVVAWAMTRVVRRAGSATGTEDN